MRTLVLLKHVPDPAGRPVLEGGVPTVDSATGVVNETDLSALEAALRLRERAAVTEVVVLTLGTEATENVLRKALALGADRAIRLEVDVDEGDVVDVARALAAAVTRIDPTLVLAGAQSSWLGRAAIGGAVAACLDWPHAWLVTALEPVADGSGVEVLRELEGGESERCRLPLPAVLALQVGAYPPRLASVRGTLAARRQPIDCWSAAEVGLDPRERGRPRSQVVEWSRPSESSTGERLEGSVDEMVATLLERLATRGLA